MNKISNTTVEASLIIIAIRLFESVLGEMFKKKRDEKAKEEIKSKPTCIVAPMPRNVKQYTNEEEHPISIRARLTQMALDQREATTNAD